MESTTDKSSNGLKPSNSIFKKAKNEFGKLRKMTLRTLSQCKETGKAIVVSSHALGEGRFVSFVEDIYQNDVDEIVVLKWYDKNNFASLTHVFIEEILSVKPMEKRPSRNFA
jgi:hypothetical protein